MDNKTKTLPITFLKPNPKNARTHSKSQIDQIAKSIERFGYTAPILIDETMTIICGHGRLQAAQKLGLQSVPVRVVSDLTDTQKRALMIADNKIAENAGWDRSLLASELAELAIELPKLDLDISITGFDTGELDAIFDMKAPDKPDPADTPTPPPSIPVTHRGDLWILGEHRLLCGDARSSEDVERLMNGDKARLVFIDPPYNVRVAGHVGGRGQTKHSEFAFASGEMTSQEFIAFLKASIAPLVAHSLDGSLHYICIDWRHQSELMTAASGLYAEQKNLVVWDKKTPGQGRFYRSQHELIHVYKKGDAPHINAVKQGRYGRNRSNVWAYSGVNSFGKDRLKELALHPTVKPIALVVDALRDASLKGDIVLDTFLGSGTTLLAAERADRKCRGLEFEPKYVDVAIARWQDFTRRDAILDETGETFVEVKARRSQEAAAAEARHIDEEAA